MKERFILIVFDLVCDFSLISCHAHMQQFVVQHTSLNVQPN